MTRFLKFLVFVPIATILVALSVANRDPITLSLDPFNAAEPAYAVSFPLFWLLFGTFAVGLICGGMVTWFKQGKFRREARDQKYAVMRAEAETEEVKQRVRTMAPNALPSLTTTSS